MTLTVAQAAAELGVSPVRVRALIAAGRIATTRFGNSHAIDPRALAAVRVRRTGRPAKARS